MNSEVPPPAMHEARFYVSTYTTNTPGKGIYVGGIDTKTGKLSVLKAAGAGETADPSFVAVSPDGRFLYAALEKPEGAVAAFRIGPGGMLTWLNEQPSGGAGCCHVWVDATGRNVFAANYHGGSIVCIQTNEDGSLGKRTAFTPFSGSGPHPTRQKKPFGHFVASDPTNRFVYCCDLGSDSVWSLKFDASKGTLTPNDPPAAKVEAGQGPRHLVAHPKGNFAFVCNELGNTVTAFTSDPAIGALAPQQTLSSLPEGTSGEGMSCAEICCHPTGKWLYVSNRDVADRRRDSIAVYAIGEAGRLTLIEITSAQVQQPRGVAIDPTGQWLVAAGQKDNRLVVMKINQTTGKLEVTDQSAEVPVPVCVLFAPFPPS